MSGGNLAKLTYDIIGRADGATIVGTLLITATSSFNRVQTDHFLVSQIGGMSERWRVRLGN